MVRSWNVGRKDRVRAAVVSDAHAIARVHVESWKTTYAGIFPEALLNDLSIEKREQFWAEELGKPRGGSVTFVALDYSGEIVGFVSGGPERTGELGCDGELYAIYLLERAQRRSLGTLLAKRLARELISRGSESMAVWVLAENPFRNFYEALGGKLIREQTIERWGQEFIEVAYGWNDLAAFE